jgi:hypothetical protein
LILKDVIIEKKIKIFNIAVLYLLLFACFFYIYGLVSWQSADPGIETYAVYWGGGGGGGDRKGRQWATDRR